MNVTFNTTLNRQTAEQVARHAGIAARRAMNRQRHTPSNDMQQAILIAAMGLAAVLCYAGAAICFVMALT